MSKIKKEISPATLFNEIKLQRAVHKGSFLLVEGDTDARFYSSFIDSARCNIVNCSNRSNVVGAIVLLDGNQFSGALGLMDRDFSGVINENVPSENIVWTDGNDAEVMIIKSRAFEKIIEHYGSADKVRAVCSECGFELREIIAAEAAKIGVMRLASRSRGLNLKFEGMSYSFESNASFRIDSERMATHVLARTGNGLSRDVFKIACDELSGFGYENMSLVNGHDFIRILARALKRDVGTTNVFEVDSVELEKVFRLAYEREFFTDTSLYADIKSWEAVNQPYVVLIF